MQNYGMSNRNGGSNNNNNNEAIVEKLQGSLAAFRRERDELHRKKQLSAERLRLICEEKDALEKTVNALKDKLTKLNEQASGAAERDVQELERKVNNLTREVQFQHAELVSKRDKVAALQKGMEEDAMARDHAIRSQNETIRKTRELIASLESSAPSTTANKKMETQLETLQREMNDCNSERLWKEWPVLLEQKATAITMEAADWHRSSEALERVLEGYKKQFGLSSSSSSSSSAMMEEESKTDVVDGMEQ